MDEDVTKLQNRVEALFQQNPYAVALWSTDLKIVDVNGAFLVRVIRIHQSSTSCS